MRRADDIVTLTEDMANRIRGRIIHLEKVRVITNPISLPGIGDAEGKADAGKGGRKRFVALFAGNMGPAQGLKYILEASVILQQKGSRCEILLVGDGSEKEALSRVATEKSLTNVKFMPYQTPEALREIYSKADVAIVSLAPGLSSMALPSKLYTAMAAGCPVLGLFDAGSEAEKLVTGQNIGKAITDYDPASIADMIERMASQPEELFRMARNAKLYAEQNLSSGNFLKKFTNILVSGESKNA
jgi:Glycosyltransferase